MAARPGGGILGSGRAILASENQYDLDLVDSLRAARAETGKSAIAQLVEIALLTLTGARIGALDYYRYRLYDNDRHDWASKRRFIGNRRCREINRRVIDRNFWDQVEDKLLAASILAEAGFRVPAVRAVFGDVEPVPGACRGLDVQLAGDGLCVVVDRDISCDLLFVNQPPVEARALTISQDH